MRFCDVKRLTYGDIDYQNKIISFRQRKVEGRSHRSGVVTPMNVGTQTLTNGANVKVVRELMGHSSLKYTLVYLRAVDEEKKRALNSLPKIKI